MYFNNIGEILEISKRTGCAIFVVSDSTTIKIKDALLVSPDDKAVITVEQIREVIGSVSAKQTNDKFIIIQPADRLSDVAANAFLKSLEEPNEKIHYLLITNHPSKLPKTILSRANIYFLRKNLNMKEVDGEEKEKELAKKLIVAQGQDLVMIAEKIAVGKSAIRKYALDIVGIAIMMIYKSYFITKKEIFLKKLPKFLKLYENLERNGHIKLHIVADLC